jgi:hypothetical protein
MTLHQMTIGYLIRFLTDERGLTIIRNWMVPEDLQ